MTGEVQTAASAKTAAGGSAYIRPTRIAAKAMTMALNVVSATTMVIRVARRKGRLEIENWKLKIEK